MDTFRLTRLQEIQQQLGYTFQNSALLDIALTHSSFAKGEGKAEEHNERLEFLGDAVLELCVSEYLFRNYPAMDEGRMTRLRALAVYEPSLYIAAKELGLGDALLLARGEERSGGREKPSILADATEAVIGAIFLDGGMEPASRFILRFASDAIKTAAENVDGKDHKTRLQEYAQKQHLGNAVYQLVGTSGPDHKKVFEMQVLIGGKTVGEGKGGTKQEAGQQAAKEALKALGVKGGE